MISAMAGKTASAADLARAPHWWRGAVIYQIYPRSFADSNGDGIGDLRGICSKLDYVAGLGVDAIWISPFFRSPMRDFGYDISDYRQVDPMFGNLEDFDRLVREAHARGLRVLIDQVLSHNSDEHPWFQESRSDRSNDKADWYVWADPRADGTPPNNWLSIFGGSAWQWEPRRCQYYLHNFLVSQPDLNFHQPQVRARMLEEMEFWLKRGVDGFRLDAINFCFHDAALRDNPPKPPEQRVGRGFAIDNPYAAQRHIYDNTRPENLAFLESVRALMDRYPGTVTLGEISSEDSLATVAEYTAGQRLHMAYSFELLTETFSTRQVRQVVEAAIAADPEALPCWAIGNHDVARVASRWANGNPHASRARLLNALLFSLPGSVCSYQGEELGLTQVDLPREALQDPYGIAFWPTFKGRDGCRTPMPWSDQEHSAGFSHGRPWLPVPDEHRAQAVERQQSAPGSVLESYRSFLRWRREQPALRLGRIRFLDTPAETLCFLREHEDQRLLACFNFDTVPCTIPLGGLAVEALAGHGFAPCDLKGGSITLPACSAFFGSTP